MGRAPAALAAAVLAVAAAALARCAEELRVDTALGAVVGWRHEEEKGIDSFLGLPYAQQPVGELRWQPPQPLTGWEGGELIASSPRPDSVCCVQSSFFGRYAQSEACLFLNIIRPSGAEAGSDLPVMVWIHGGGLESGCGEDAARDIVSARRPRLVSEGVIVVTINYRLNVFGFLGGDAIRARTSDGSSGSFGIQDQQAALAWVHEHIDSFGGDPERITIFGESAGGWSVSNHLVRPASHPFFSGAIIQSGAQGSYDSVKYPAAGQAKTTEKANREFAAMCRRGGCLGEGDVEHLLALEADEVLRLSEDLANFRSEPEVDGVSLPASPAELVAAGVAATVPVLITSTRDEMSLFLQGFGIETEEDFDCLLTEACAAAVLPRRDISLLLGSSFLTPSELEDAKVYYSSLFYEYPEDRGTYSRWWWTLMRLLTDNIPGFGRCSSRALGDALMRADPSAAVYEAHFVRPVDDHTDWCFTEECSSARNDGVHAVHAMDLDYVFEHPEAPEARELSDAVELYWTAFAKSGDPNVAGLPPWPARTLTSDTLMSFGGEAQGGLRVEEDVRRRACDWQERVAQRRAIAEE